MTYQRHQGEDITLKPVSISTDKPRKDGTWLFMYHIYIGPVYQGCIQALNPTHALSEWAKMHRIGQVILRAEESTTSPPVKVKGMTKRSKKER
jgi:hypothetical protein